MISTLFVVSFLLLRTTMAINGKPGEQCIFGNICSGGSICVDNLCACVDRHRELDGVCLDEALHEKLSGLPPDPSEPVNIKDVMGLAGQKCGRGGVCRPSTKCIRGVCRCRQGYNPSFGECIRDPNVQRSKSSNFVSEKDSYMRFPTR